MRSAGRGRDLPVSVLAITGVGVLAFAVGLAPAGLVLLMLGVAAVVAVAVGPRGRDADQPDDVHGRRWASADDEALRVAQWRLTTTLEDPAQVEGSLRPQLTSLVVARLARRGVTLSTPGTRELLGEPLWAFLTGPSRTRALRLRELETLLTDVERL